MTGRWLAAVKHSDLMQRIDACGFLAMTTDSTSLPEIRCQPSPGSRLQGMYPSRSTSGQLRGERWTALPDPLPPIAGVLEKGQL